MDGPAHEIRDAVLARRMSAAEVVGAALGRIGRENGVINAFTQVFEESARASARAVDDLVRAGADATSLPLAGVPVAVKENICTSVGRTTCGSRILEGYESPFDATAVRRLIGAGAVVVGKTNMDEFAMGSSTERSIFGPTRNPRDVTRVAGGSSGGSAAAVAAGLVPIALGSDTGGSIRQPAAFCGVVGLKPTYGRVSRYGLVAYASSLDQIGPIATTVGDAALTLGVMSGFDRLDATSSERAAADFADPETGLEVGIEGLRVAVPRQARSPANDPAASAVFEAGLDRLRGAGAVVEEVDLSTTELGIAAYYIVAPAEASSNLARFDGVRYGRRAGLAAGEGLAELYARSRGEGFGAEVKRRIMLGTHVLSSGYYDAYYTTACRARRLIKEDFDRVFSTGAHVVAMPTTPGPAFKAGEKTEDPLAMYLEDAYTVTVNLAGLPAVSLPAGWVERDGARLPVGMQLIGSAFDESVLMRAARMFERTG